MGCRGNLDLFLIQAAVFVLQGVFITLNYADPFITLKLLPYLAFNHDSYAPSQNVSSHLVTSRLVHIETCLIFSRKQILGPSRNHIIELQFVIRQFILCIDLTICNVLSLFLVGIYYFEYFCNSFLVAAKTISIEVWTLFKNQEYNKGLLCLIPTIQQ